MLQEKAEHRRKGGKTCMSCLIDMGIIRLWIMEIGVNNLYFQIFFIMQHKFNTIDKSFLTYPRKKMLTIRIRSVKRAREQREYM